MLSLGTANEEGTFIINCAFTDAMDGSKVVPKTLKWSLTNRYGTIINNLNQVEVTPTGESVTIILTGKDLSVLERESARMLRRYFIIEGTYDSSIQANLPVPERALFYLKNLHHFSKR